MLKTIGEQEQMLSSLLAQAAPYLLVSPPRACSTALARALSQHTQIGSYYHEPCSLYYYEESGAETIVQALEGLEKGCLIKEMSFQFRDPTIALSFLRHARKPPVFLVRDPRLSVESRIRMVLGDLAGDPSSDQICKQRIAEAITFKFYADVGDLLTDSLFPLIRSGWEDLGLQMAVCHDNNLDFIVVEASRFRSEPASVLRGLCGYWGLPFEREMLSWVGQKDAPKGALSRHDSWYTRISTSHGILPPEKHVIRSEHFPERFRSHLPKAQDVYAKALASKHVL